MIDVNDLRKGVVFEMHGFLYKVLEYSFSKPGRGNATIRIKARDLRKGNTLEKTFTSGERIQDVRLDYHNVQYLYNDGELYYFMDLETYEQPAISSSVIGDYSGFL
jgi:elongation factor P